MDIDIGFWLSLALLITLIVWAADKLFSLSAKHKAVAQGVETSNSLISVFFIVLVIRSFLIEPFTIPSGSMLPTLQINDFILVNKFSYGLRLPVTNQLIVETGKPERGDVMVFLYPENRSQRFIKRVVGLPGDTVKVADNNLWVNGELVEKRLVRRGQDGLKWTEEYIETLGDQPHMMWRMGVVNPFSGRKTLGNPNNGEWEVPQGAYFVMGDNRDNSSDSREWGIVPEELIVGEAFFIWMHWKPFGSLPSFSRNGAIDKVEEE